MQMQTLSARIPTEDLEWLSGLDLQGAASPSDKVRALIGQLRRQHEGTLDYQRSLAWLRDLVAPFVSAVGTLEHRNQMHSEVLRQVSEALPQIMATLLSERRLTDDATKRATEIEQVVVQRCFQLLMSFLRLAVTREAACYNSKVLDPYVPQVLEIAEIIAQTRKMRETNHV